jgi:hypothetical protein
MHGDAGMKSWVKGCSIHHSFQRAVTIHGTHRVLLESNVAYDIMGHTYFFEDALEWGELDGWHMTQQWPAVCSTSRSRSAGLLHLEHGLCSITL